MNGKDMTEADDKAGQAQSLVLVTGPSGAGRSTALRVLEDLGYEPIDNLPLSLIPRLLEGPPIQRPLALGIDVRNRDFSVAGLIELIDRLTASPDTHPEVLFLDCRPDELIRRFGETRRRHPLAPSEEPALGVQSEIDLLVPIRARANVLIDTSDLSPHDLKAEIARWFDRAAGGRLAVSVQSFSYKRGAPRGLDLMFDCRFLRNPHWEDRLRALDGRDQAVVDHITEDPDSPNSSRACAICFFSCCRRRSQKARAMSLSALAAPADSTAASQLQKRWPKNLQRQVGRCLRGTGNWNAVPRDRRQRRVTGRDRCRDRRTWWSGTRIPRGGRACRGQAIRHPRHRN